MPQTVWQQRTTLESCDTAHRALTTYPPPSLTCAFSLRIIHALIHTMRGCCERRLCSFISLDDQGTDGGISSRPALNLFHSLYLAIVEAIDERISLVSADPVKQHDDGEWFLPCYHPP
jgi:hypothetical protein